MMLPRYNDSRHVGAILKDVFENLGYLERFKEARAKETWIELAGPTIYSVTTDVYVRKGILYVDLNCSAWRQELHMNRDRWCAKLNKALPKPMIRKIVFR